MNYQEELQERLRNRWNDVLSQAEELREQYPDPIKALQEIFSDLEIDDETWREIIEELYG